jgi:hypothetical protein
LNDIWRITRKNIEVTEGIKPDYNFALQMQKRENEEMPIKFKVYAEYYDFPEGASWKERVLWEMDFSHQLLDIENYYLLLRE